jgi:predicted aspartyl protease
MRFATVSLALMILAGGPAFAQDCGPLKQAASLDLTPLGNGGQMLVPVTINGAEQKMLLNTAGGISSLTQTAVDALGLHAIDGSRIKSLDSAGNASQSYVAVRDFALGGVQFNGIQFMVTANPNAGANGLFAGMLAGDIMSHYDVEMNFATRKLNIFLQDHCPGHVLYWKPDPAAIAVVPISLKKPTPTDSRTGFRPYVDREIHIWVPVTLDGKSFKAALNTGAARSTMSARVAKFVFGVTADTPGSVPLGTMDANPDHKVFGHVFSALTFDGVTVANPHIAVIPDLVGSKDPNNDYRTDSHIKRVDDDFGAEMTIGMDVIRKLHLYIAFGERKLYVTPAAAQVQGDAGGSPQPSAAH